MDCRLFLGTAQFLKNKGADEAAFRSSISRAYYACFLAVRNIAFTKCARDILNSYGIYKESSIMHEPLQQWLKNGANENVRKLGIDLAGLCGNRREADYEMRKSISKDDAIDAINEAEEIFKRLDAIYNDIGPSLEKYIRSIITATAK